ncbi:MAG: phenylalanine--tRNA ligase subunit beta [Eubacteriales bacterium]|nr:phenylalanine--tRNA ligase subunit beta [Eubacteriales bacterium]
MLVSIGWLKDYVDIDVSDKEFCDRMIMSGSNIETAEEIGTGMTGVVIGRIDAIEKHPDADKLVVCKINVGAEEPLQIVTGADNIHVGDYVPVATHNSHIPGPLHGQPKVEGGVKITKGKLRGVMSEGMLCGPQELGVEDKVAPMISKDGIWLLPGNLDDKLGQPLDEVLGLKDTVVDFEITPNRPDCLSMLGMAREASAVFGHELKYPATECEKADEKAEDIIKVDVESDLCKRYTARVIKNVKIEQSPWWLQKRLMAAGMRPINNIVDLTNFVMLEYGQPLHAFDIRHLSGKHIIVKTAENGTKFVTLDGTERELDDTMLTINDENGPVALAGVMGGLNSEIVDDTDTVVLEAASFVGSNIRKTSKKLNLRTEASGRYEKGIDPNLCHEAADRFCRLVQDLGAGTVLEGAVDVYKNPETAPTVTARVSRINKVLGTDIPREQMVKYLESLEMKVEGEGDEMIVTPPSVRQDLLEEVDYVEEVARMYGYDNLPMSLPDVGSSAIEDPAWDLRQFARDLLSGMGCDEIQTYSFSSDKDLDQAGVPKDTIERDFVKITNPMGEDTSALRTMLLPAMLQTMALNYNRGNDFFRGYEIGTVFANNIDKDAKLPVETKNLSLGSYGEGEDFYTLKGIIETLLDRFGIRDIKFRAESEYGTFHPGRCARIIAKTAEGQPYEIGIMGEVHPDIAKGYGIDGRAYAAELFFDTIIANANREVEYQKPPKYPASTRDLAVIVDEDLEVGTVKDAISEVESDILRDVQLFDVYRGLPIPPGKKSIAFTLTYRADDRTLTVDEIDAVQAEVTAMVKDRFDAILRD